MVKIGRALLSVTDKSGLVEFAKKLSEMGIELISTGGTAAKLREAGLEVTGVSDVTRFPEMLDGRVKTLHPRIHGGILARRDKESHMAKLAEEDIKPIDMVVVNLYQFGQAVADPACTIDSAIENIDIGGPTLIRASAKNYASVVIVVDPTDYPLIIKEMAEENGQIGRPMRWQLAKKAFAMTAAYDKAISVALPRWDQKEGC